MTNPSNRRSSRHAPLDTRQQVPAGAKIRYPLDLRRFLPFRLSRAGYYMSAAGHRLSDLVNAVEVPIREREWRVLSVLGAEGSLTSAELSDISGIDPSAVSRAVKILTRLELVKTLKSKRDRRRALLVITKEGAKIHDEIARKRIETGEEIAAGITSEELESFLVILDKIEAHTRGLANRMEDSEWEIDD